MASRISIYLLMSFSALFILSCQTSEIDEILQFDNEAFTQILDDPQFEFQMQLTEVIQEVDKTEFITHRYNYDSLKYFYPASTVKLPAAILALQRINELQGEGYSINRNTPFLVDSTNFPQTVSHADSTTLSGYPTVENHINRIFAVSDNDAYNRLYEFLGSDYINSQLQSLDVFSNSRVVHRVGALDFDVATNFVFNPYRFINGDSVIYQQEIRTADIKTYPKLNDTSKGVAYYKNGIKIESPFDMSKKNFMNVHDMEAIMKRIFHPEIFEESQRFNLNEDQLTFLRECMQKTPREHTHLNYDTTEYYDSYVKFFIYGDTKDPIPNHINIYNKVGYAYGYLTDISYIEDTKNDISFYLTATVHVNANQTYNDNNYEYEELGIPFLAQLGRNVYDYVINKKKRD